MRKTFANELYKQMVKNDSIYLLVGDLGYGLWDKIRKDFPDRFINCGAAEMAMMDIAVGLALSDKIPFVYSITPFLLYRPFESLRLYINHENISVKLVGSGRGGYSDIISRDYEELGFSHWADEDTEVMKLFPNIECLCPTIKEHIADMVDEMVENEIPYYINLSTK